MNSIGKLIKNVDVAETYKQLALHDEEVAKKLYYIGEYRHSIYFFIQSMEKLIKAKIYTLVNPNIPYFRDHNKDHSLDKSIDFLLEIISTDDNIRNQVREQIYKYVLKDIKYNQLHNDLRYPFYSSKYNNFCLLEFSAMDCLIIENNLNSLKTYLNQLDRLE